MRVQLLHDIQFMSMKYSYLWVYDQVIYIRKKVKFHILTTSSASMKSLKFLIATISRWMLMSWKALHRNEKGHTYPNKLTGKFLATKIIDSKMPGKKRMRDICDRSQHWHPSLMCKNKILSTFQSITFSPPTQHPPVNPPSRRSHHPAPSGNKWRFATKIGSQNCQT